MLLLTLASFGQPGPLASAANPEPISVAGPEFLECFLKNFHYPDTAKGSVVGRIVVKFVVNEDGSISNCEVQKGKELEGEILRVMKLMPKVKPGMQEGKPVKISFTLPINIHWE